MDGLDAPAGQTTAANTLHRGNDPIEDPQMVSTMVTGMTAAAHTINLDGSVDATTTTPEGEQRSLWAVTMELPATKNFLLMGVVQ